MVEVRNLLPSVLDRLLGGDPPRPYTVKQACDAVKRDLKALLNAYQGYGDELPPELVKLDMLGGHILQYGLPDFLTFDSQYDKERICNELEQMIKNFEPRLMEVSVDVRKTESSDIMASGAARTQLSDSLPAEPLLFSVTAKLRLEIDPRPEREPDAVRVEFNATVRLNPQSTTIEDET